MNKRLLTVSIAGIIAAPMSAHALKYKLSGQVNRAVIYMDDGVQSDVRNVDASTSSSRFTFKGSEDLGNGVKAGVFYELLAASSTAAETTPDADSARNSDIFNIRQANVWFSGNWGKLSLGQQDGAGNGTTEADLSGTWISGTYASKNDMTDGIAWRSSAPGGAQLVNAAGTALVEGDTYSNFDAFNRYDAVRYDTPALGPVTLSVSAGNDQLWEVAGRAKTALGGGQLSAGLFYGQDTGSVNGSSSKVTATSAAGVSAPITVTTATEANNVHARWGGSLSYLFSQGTNITGHYARNNPQTGADAKSFSVKLGQKWGANAVSIGYAKGEDVAGRGFDDSGWNIGYVYALRKAKTQLYAAFLHSELDTPAGTASAKDHNAVLVGARVKFD